MGNNCCSQPPSEANQVLTSPMIQNNQLRLNTEETQNHQRKMMAREEETNNEFADISIFYFLALFFRNPHPAFNNV
jgi:hypothetical protein